jgi:hypothetical protein
MSAVDIAHIGHARRPLAEWLDIAMIEVLQSAIGTPSPFHPVPENVAAMKSPSLGTGRTTVRGIKAPQISSRLGFDLSTRETAPNSPSEPLEKQHDL